MSENLAAIHFRQIQVQQNEVRPRGVLVFALPPEKRHGLHAVGSQMQGDRSIDVAKGLPRQPGIAGIVFNQENLHGPRFIFDDIHDLVSAIAMNWVET